MYRDVVQGRDRPRRAKRKVKRGPMSGAEKAVNRAFLQMIKQMRLMDGELSDLCAKEFTALFASVTHVMKGYSFEVLRDPQSADWDRLRDQLYIIREEQVDGFDVGDLSLLARVGAIMKPSPPGAPSIRAKFCSEKARKKRPEKASRLVSQGGLVYSCEFALEGRGEDCLKAKNVPSGRLRLTATLA